MSKRKRCAFCGASDVKITNEHAWPNWMRSLFPPFPTTIIGTLPSRAPITYQPSSDDMGVRVNDFCEACNHGWMNDLENEVKPFLALMIAEGTGVVLTSSQQGALARWAIKTAMVFEFTSRAERFYTFEERDALRTGRLPPATLIFMARYQGSTFVSTAHGKRFVFSVQVGDETFPMAGNNVTISVGQFVVQVFSARPRADLHGVWIPWDSSFDRFIVRLWPPTDVLPSWPPGAPLDAKSLEDFIHRGAPTTDGSAGVP